MANLNKVQLIGRLGSDPELKQTKSGSAVVGVSLATTEKWTSKNGEKHEHTEWHRLQFWNRSAEIISEYCNKGSLLYIEGSLRANKYEDKDGVERTLVNINVREFQFLGMKNDSSGVGSKSWMTGGSRSYESKIPDGYAATAVSSGNFRDELHEDSIPF